MRRSSSSSSGNLGFCGALAILFIGLKLGNVISWSWWWVLSPLWVPVLIVLAIVVVCGIGYLCFAKLPRSLRRRLR